MQDHRNGTCYSILVYFSQVVSQAQDVRTLQDQYKIHYHSGCCGLKYNIPGIKEYHGSTHLQTTEFS